MRTPPDDTPWRLRLSACVWLILANVIFYAAQLIVPLAGMSDRPPPALEPYLALFPGDLAKGYLWELLTFQFLHAGVLHIGLNCAMLYMFGRPVEAALGRANFLKLYFGSGVLGGLTQAVVSLAFPAHFGLGPVVGASAGVFGVIAAFAALNANLPITTLVAFILPVTMRAKYLIVVELVLAVLGMLRPAESVGVAHAAHLGGILAGLAYVLYGLNWPRRSQVRHDWQAVSDHQQELVKATAVRSAAWRRQAPPPGEDLPPAEFISKEVDPILEKISAHGIQSLTPRERRILELARDKMRRS
jgi:membrane associated rhomboid family serine protease